ncbi:hypothetical protein ACFL1L_05590 [Thermoplasmatota archaeon]
MKFSNNNFNRLIILTISAIMCLTALAMLPTVSAVPTTFDFGDLTLTSNGAFDSDYFCPIFDLTQSDITISFTYDGNGLLDGTGQHAWSELGVRTWNHYVDFNPNGAGIWFTADYLYSPNAFDPDVIPIFDMDDKLLLQKVGGQGEGAYNLPSVPPVSGDNHRFWWDRDGVDPYQNDECANTGGIYNIEIVLSATSSTDGTAYMTINGLSQGFEVDGNWNTIDIIPAGMTFTADMTKLRVFYGLYGYGGTHSVSFNDVTVTGTHVGCDVPVCRNVEDNIEYCTIQEAVDAGTTNNGETIEVYPVSVASTPICNTLNSIINY